MCYNIEIYQLTKFMKKSKRNYKKIIVITLAILISLGGALYGVNTKQLTGFTGVGKQDFKQRFNPAELNINTQTSSTQNTTPTRFEAVNSELNKSKIKCNGIWQKGLEFVINYKQSSESLQLIHDKLHEFNKKGCQIAVQHQGLMPDRRTTIPGNNAYTKTMYCNGDIHTSNNNFECLIDDIRSYNGVTRLKFLKKFNQSKNISDEMQEVEMPTFSEDGQTLEENYNIINQQNTAYIINILIK